MLVIRPAFEQMISACPCGGSCGKFGGFLIYAVHTVRAARPVRRRLPLMTGYCGCEVYSRPTHRMVRLTEVECEELLFLPVIVNGYVPVRALQFTEMVSFELPGAVAGFRLKLALVLCGNPLTLRLTELEPPLALSETVEAPFEPRFAVIDDAEMPKSTAGAETTTVRVVE